VAMTKAELIDALAARTKLSHSQADSVVSLVSIAGLMPSSETKRSRFAASAAFRSGLIALTKAGTLAPELRST
jgi:hypothetical protein